jgi:hypothetical protein
MSSKSGSCLGTFLMIVLGMIVIRFLLPELWIILAGIFRGTLYFSGLLIASLLALLGYFTYRNLQKNKQSKEQKKFLPVTKAETLYRSVLDRLQRDITLNQVSAEEFLQAELLMTEKLQQLKEELVRLKDFASPANERSVREQIRDYEQQQRESKDPTVLQLMQENLRILMEKKERIKIAADEIRQKEGLLNLMHNCLLNVDEDLKFGRSVRRIFPADLYSRFGLQPPAEQHVLPPLPEKSSTE